MSDRAGESAPGIMHAYASLTFETDTGELIRLDIQNPDWASAELPAPGLAKEKAAEFARQVLGDKMKDYQMSAQIGYGGGSSLDDKGNEITWASANVQFERLINGIPFLNSGIQVSVDAAGHVTKYYTEGFYRINDGSKDSEPDPAVFPAPSLAITREAAEKVFAGLLEMKLNYVGSQPLKYPVFGGKKVETRPVLMYTPSNCATIDAVTGKPQADFQWQPQTSRISLAGRARNWSPGLPKRRPHYLRLRPV